MSSYKDRVMKRIPDRPKTGIRAKASGLVGRGKGDSSAGPTTVARPISELRDPATFAAPPRRTGTGLAPPPPPSSTAAPRKVITAPSKYQDPRAAAIEPPPKTSSHPAVAEAQQPQQLLLEDREYREPARKPYKTDSTGLRTDHLPPPPGRRDNADGRNPPVEEETSTAVVSKRPPPSLPPRLPARGAARSPQASSPARPPPSGQLNQGAVNRLGAAGVSVPGFEIGSSNPPNTSSPSPPPPPRQARTPNAQVDELQNRFSKLGTASTPSKSAGDGTTWSQKQSALKTASSFQKDPSSVSLSDARSAAGTANNFRQRHGEQAAAGVKSANTLNQKYGVMDKAGAYAGRLEQAGQPGQESGGQGAGPPAVPGLAGKKKPPPPPPKKKPALLATATGGPGDGPPPPVPMSTRPAF